MGVRFSASAGVPSLGMSGAPTPALPHFGFPLYVLSRDSSGSIATFCGLDGPGIESRGGARFSAPVQIHPGAHPASDTVRKAAGASP